ncbi:hypothetical protein BD408DRAFT_452684 [Parasitella parasitica]|nr:hypothetical protein BD408DRAFT_452684 [Parasitella parasitica]
MSFLTRVPVLLCGTIRKILLEDQEAIDIVTKDLLNVYEDSYTIDSAQILANGSSVTYIPHLAVHSALPPITFQFNLHASQDTMINAIDQYFQVYLRSNQLPMQSKSYLYHLPNTVWRSFGQDAPKDENLNELVALLMCLLQDKQTIATVGRSLNAAIQYLYDRYKTTNFESKIPL